MESIKNWDKIRTHFSKSFSSSLHVSIASVDENNLPANTPIGSLFLNHDQTGFYFEKFPSKLPKHANTKKDICVLAVNSSKWFWTKSMFQLKFSYYPAIKLYGTLGEKRKSTETEIKALKRRMRLMKRFKGYSYLWGDMQYVREIHFAKAEVIKLGKMTNDL